MGISLLLFVFKQGLQIRQWNMSKGETDFKKS